MNAFWVGVLVGLIPYVLYRVNRRFKHYNGDTGPLLEFWYGHPPGKQIMRVRWHLRRWRRNARGRWDGWWATHVWSRLRMVRFLARRTYRVTIVSVCFYGNDPDQGGAPPRVTGVGWTWTKWGAEWKRRHGWSFATLGSFRYLTYVDHKPSEPLDPTQSSWWGAFFRPEEIDA